MKIPESLADVLDSDEYKAITAALPLPLRLELNSLLRDTFIGGLKQGEKPWREIFGHKEDAA